jgi:hypothetical protein
MSDFINWRLMGSKGKAAIQPTDGYHARTGHAFPKAGASKPKRAAVDETPIKQKILISPR